MKISRKSPDNISKRGKGEEKREEPEETTPQKVHSVRIMKEAQRSSREILSHIKETLSRDHTYGGKSERREFGQ